MTNKPTDHEIDVFVQVCREKGMRELDVFQAVLARWGQQATQEAVGEVVWAAGVPNSIREVHLKKWDLPIGTKLYTSPQPAHSGEPVAWLDPWTGTKVATDYDAYGKHGIPLYTAPQPVEREPLPSVEIMRIVMGVEQQHNFLRGTTNWATAVGRAVERAHGIGGQHDF